MKENKKWEEMTLKEKFTGCITLIIFAIIAIYILGWGFKKCSAPSKEDMLPVHTDEFQGLPGLQRPTQGQTAHLYKSG